MEKTPLCSACHAHFMTKWGDDDDVITLVADEGCAFRECPRSECLSEPAEPTEPTIFRVIFDLEIDGVLVPVDASGTFDPKAMRYEGHEELRCFRTDGPAWVEIDLTDAVRAVLTAKAAADWRATDWEAQRRDRMERDRAEADDAFNQGWDSW
jgi:hypothetical protein